MNENQQQNDALNNAVAMLALESQLVWQRYSAYLTGNTILVAICAAIMSAQKNVPLIVPICGWLLCAMWHFVNRRGCRQCGTYDDLVRELEKTAVPDSLQFHRLAAERNSDHHLTGRHDVLANLSIVLYAAVYVYFGV